VLEETVNVTTENKLVWRRTIRNSCVKDSLNIFQKSVVLWSITSKRMVDNNKNGLECRDFAAQNVRFEI